MPVMKDENKLLKPAQVEKLSREIQAYFLDEFELEIGDLQTSLFLEFIEKELGKEYYNAGVLDSIQAIKDKAEDINLLLRD